MEAIAGRVPGGGPAPPDGGDQATRGSLLGFDQVVDADHDLGVLADRRPRRRVGGDHLVADRRALTPSEAAELAVPSHGEMRELLDRLRRQAVAGLRDRAARARMQLESWESRPVFRRPLQGGDERRQRVDDLAAELTQVFGRAVERRGAVLAETSARLEALSPLQVLRRGYSITHREADGRVLKSADETDAGELLRTVLQSGEIISEVRTVRPGRLPHSGPDTDS